MSAICGVYFRLGRTLLASRTSKEILLESIRYKGSKSSLISSILPSLFKKKVTFSIYSPCYSTELRKEGLGKQRYENEHFHDLEFQEEEEELKKKRDAQWHQMKLVLILMSSFFGFSFCYMFYILGSPKKDEDGNDIEDEFSSLPVPTQFFKRMLREIDYYNKMMSRPVTDKLLPDPLSPPYYQPKYTLILELTDLLTHADWTYQTGWRFKKRPGVDKFLELVTMPLFELVVFTSEQSMAAYPLLEVLDPNGYILYKLSKTSAEYVDGHYVKNLDCLNRDLSKVIVVDWNESAVKYHRNNALIIPRWTGQDDDTTLVDLAVFLRTIAVSDIDDVREVLSFYSKYENPVEAFRENQRKLLEQMEEDEEKRKGISLASKWADTFLKQQYRFK